MSNARLEVEIGASTKEFQKKLQQSLQALDNFKKEQDRLKKAFDKGNISQNRYYSELTKNTLKISNASKLVSKYKKSITGVDNSMGGLRTSTANLGKTTANAVPAVTEFSRVIQDAPFGIQGVANNITQLTQNFGYLKKQTGSTKGALKAMVGTLTGPAGVLLAVSAVTSIMVSHGDVIMNLIKGNNALASSQKAVTSALDDFYGGQVTKIQSYISILGKANTSETQRKELTEELIRLVPSLKKEDFNYGSNLDIVRKKIGQYVLAQASRIEADTLVQENSEKLSHKYRITKIKEIKDEKKRIEEITKLLKDAGKDIMQTRSTMAGSGMGMIGFETVQKTKAQIIDTFENFENELTKDLKPIEDRINQLYSDTFSGGLGGSGKPPKNVFVEEKQVKFNEEILETVNIGQSDSEKEWNTINWEEYYKLKEFDKQRNLLNERMLNLSQTADTLINQSISNSFNSLANNIANSLGRSAGFFGAFAGEIIKIGGRMLIAQLTQDKATIASSKAVSTAKAIETGVKTASKTPFGAFLLPALITAGVGAVSSAFGNIGTNAGSSNTNQNNFSGGFSGGYSSSTPQRIELYARGEELYGVLDTFLRRNGNQGGNLSLS